MVNEKFIFEPEAPASLVPPQGGDWPRAAEGGYGAANRFLSQFDGTLRRLRSTRLRFSVMRLILPVEAAGEPGLAARVSRHLDDPHVMAGLWYDESVVGAFFGPRSCGSVGDRMQARKIAQRCQQAMNDAGEADLVPFTRLLIAHCWTDETIDPVALIEALDAPCGRSV